MTDEAHWMIANDLTAQEQSPDFLDFISLEGLRAFESNAVNIIR